jgi:hypothetical protein
MFHAQGAGAAEAASEAQRMIYNLVQRQASVLAFLEDFRLMALTFLAVIPVVFLMKKIRPRKVELGAE